MREPENGLDGNQRQGKGLEGEHDEGSMLQRRQKVQKTKALTQTEDGDGELIARLMR